MSRTIASTYGAKSRFESGMGATFGLGKPSKNAEARGRMSDAGLGNPCLDVGRRHAL